MCGVESLLVQVTLVPALTVSVWGANVKFWMATVLPVAGVTAAAADDIADLGMAAAAPPLVLPGFERCRKSC